MYGTKIIVRNIPTLEPRTAHKKHLKAHQTKVTNHNYSLSAAPEVQEIAVPNPLLNSVFVQLGITTDAWLFMRAIAKEN